MFNKTDEILNAVNELLEYQLKQAFVNSFNLYVEKFQRLVDDEKIIIDNSAKEAIDKINIASSKLSKIDELIKANAKLSNDVDNLLKEIRKRDAIIQRKNNQIAKLKGQ